MENALSKLELSSHLRKNSAADHSLIEGGKTGTPQSDVVKGRGKGNISFEFKQRDASNGNSSCSNNKYKKMMKVTSLFSH